VNVGLESVCALGFAPRFLFAPLTPTRAHSRRSLAPVFSSSTMILFFSLFTSRILYHFLNQINHVESVFAILFFVLCVFVGF
jgi:hypothetical protein